MSRRRNDLEVWARSEGVTPDRKPTAERQRHWAGWIKRQVAEVVAEVAALDGCRPDGALVARLTDAEDLLRLPKARLNPAERAARLADAAGIDLPPVHQPSNDRGGRA